MRTQRVVAATVLATVLLVTAGCGLSPSRPAGKGVATTIAPAPQTATVPEAALSSSDAAKYGASPARASDRMVIRNANVRLEVPKAIDAVAKLRALTARFGGVVSSLQLASDTGEQIVPQPAPDAPDRTVSSGLPYGASVTVLVPVAKLDAFRDEAEKLGKVLSERSADEDVTQQHVDLKARLDNAKAEEARLRTFFDRAQGVNDLLAIERELARVRGDIESMTAQLASLERQAAMATLTIELVEPKPIVRPSSGIDWGFDDTLTAGIQGLAGFVKVAIVVLISTSPLWIAGIAAFFLVRWRLRVRRARAEAAAGSAGTSAGGA